MYRQVCTWCGSESVQCDASASWDIKRQEWIIDGTHDSEAYCSDCNEDTSIECVECIDPSLITSGVEHWIRTSQRTYYGKTAILTPDEIIIKDEEGVEHSIPASDITEAGRST